MESEDQILGVLDKIRQLKLWHKIAIVTALFLSLYTIFGFFILPNIIKNLLENQVAQQLYRDISVQGVKFNPFNLRCTVEGFKVYKQGEKKHLLDIRAVTIDLESISLLKRALVIREVVLENPDIRVIRYKNGSFSFSDALTKMQEVKKEKEEKENRPLLFSINNIQLKDGEFHFVDELEGSKHDLTRFNLNIPFISNLKTKIDIFVTPRFSAVVDGSLWETEAKAKPFIPTRPGEVSFQFTDLELKRYFPYVDQLVQGKLKDGYLSADIKLDFRLSEKGDPIINIFGNFSLRDLAFLDPKSRKVFSIKEILVEIERSDLIEQFLIIKKITVNQPYLMVHREKGGRINLVGLLETRSPKGKKGKVTKRKRQQTVDEKPVASRKSARKKPHLFVKEFDLNEGHIEFLDSTTHSKPFKTSIKGLEFSASNIDTSGEKDGKWHIAFDFLDDADLEATGVARFSSDSSITSLAGVLEINDISIPRLYPYYANMLTGRIRSGDFSIDSLLFEITSKKNTLSANIKDIDLSLEDLKITEDSGKQVMAVKEMGLKGAEADLETETLSTGILFLRNGEIDLKILEDGRINLARLVSASSPSTNSASQPTGNEQPSSSTENKNNKDDGSEANSKKWELEIPSIDVSGLNLQITDLTAPKKAMIHVTDITVNGSGLATSPGVHGDLAVTAKINKRGSLKIDGKGSLVPGTFKGKMELASIPLAGFQSYIPKEIKMTVSRGALWATSDIDISLSGSTIKIETESNIDVRGFRALERGTGKKFLAWKDFSVKKIHFSYAPVTLKIDKVILDSPYAFMEMDRNKQLNLNRIFPPASASPKGSSSQQRENLNKREAKKPDNKGVNRLRAKTEPESIPELFVQEILMKHGIIEFRDLSVSPHFYTTLTDVTCKISGLNSIKERPATVDVSANLPGSGIITLNGKVNPFSKDIYADLTLDLRGFGLSKLTPYAGKYLGYTISKGQATVRMDLNLKQRQVEVADRIVVDQLSFGQDVKSEDATGLPVKLAVALLQDRNGRIDLKIPVKGSLDDPQFSILGTIFNVITNLIAKAATSPFSLLTAAFGASEDINIIPFEPGSSNLTEEAIKRLDTLAEILKERPALNIELMGNSSKDRDRKALFEQEFWCLLKVEKFKRMDSREREKESIENIQISQDEYPKYLKEAYKAAPFDKPRNFLGMLKSQPVEVMEKMLRNHIEITNSHLRTLANQRAEHVANYLIAEKEIGRNRVFILEPGSRKAEIPEGMPTEAVMVFIK